MKGTGDLAKNKVGRVGLRLDLAKNVFLHLKY